MSVCAHKRTQPTLEETQCMRKDSENHPREYYIVLHRILQETSYSNINIKLLWIKSGNELLEDLKRKSVLEINDSHGRGSGGVGELTTKEHEERILWSVEVFCILIMVVANQLPAHVRTHRTILQTEQIILYLKFLK